MAGAHSAPARRPRWTAPDLTAAAPALDSAADPNAPYYTRLFQGSRFSNALPLPGSKGADAWSCTMSQLPSIFRKQYVARTQKPPLLVPFFNVPLSRLKLCPNATSPPTVIVMSRTSKPIGGWNSVKAAVQFLHFASAPTS